MRGVLVLLLAARVAHAEPWDQGVPAEKQTEANKLFAEANLLFARDAHTAALDKYRAAVALWNHPLIQFNMAVTLIRLDRVLEASEHLEAALRFGSAPFPAETYKQALDYQRLVRGRVGFIQAHCTLGGARISLDGKAWLHCPGDATQRVLSGEHLVVGEHENYDTLSRRVVVTGGATSVPALDFSREGKHRAWWQRWYVLTTASVLIVGATGTAVYFATRDDGKLPISGTTH